MDQINAILAEAEKRGIVGPELMSLVQEANKRGLVFQKMMPISEAKSVGGFTPDPEFEAMGQGDKVPLLQDQSGPTEGFRDFMKSEGLPIMGGMLGSALFPPLAAPRMLQLFPKKTPSFLKDMADNFVPIPGLGPTVAKLTGEGVKQGVKFGPPVLGATLGGTAGGGLEGAFEQGILGPDDILKPFADLTLDDIPTVDQLDEVFDNARKRGMEQGVLEIAGNAVFAPLKWMLGPNADILASQNKRVLEFARKHNLPINPRSATDSRIPVVETIVDSVFPAGVLTTITNKKALSKVLEAPVPDHTNFVTTLFRLEQPNFIGNKGGQLVGGAVTKSQQEVLRTLRDIFQNSSQVVSGNSGIGNLASQARSSLLVNGDKLAVNLAAAEKAGKLKNLDPEQLEALQNFALYAKVAGEEVSGLSTKQIGPLSVPAAAATTAAITYPLYTGPDGVPGTKATPGEIGQQIAAQSFLAWMAASIVNPRGGMNRWLTNGFIDSRTAREMMRMGINASVRGSAEILREDKRPSLSLFNG